MFKIKYSTMSTVHKLCRSTRRQSGVAGLNEVFNTKETEEDLQLLRSVCDKVRKEVTQSPSPILTEWLNKIVTHLIPSSRMSRPRAAFNAFKVSCKTEPSDSLREKAAYVSWAVDFVIAHILFIDDILDNSTTRRKKPCWHTLPEVGRSAVNDACFLRSAAYRIISSHMGEHTAYNQLHQLFSTKIRQVEYGQMLEQIASKKSKEGNYELLTREFYFQRNKYMSTPMAQLPPRAGLLTGGILDPEIHKGADDILGDMGYYFQAENDFLDVFGPDYNVQKNGSDIVEGNCSWLAVEALARMTEAQKKLFEMHFGRNDQHSKIEVETLYRELKMDEVFQKMVKEFQDRTMAKISTFCKMTNLRPEIFYASLKFSPKTSHLLTKLKT